MLKVLKMTKNILKSKGSNCAYTCIKNYNLLYISPLKVHNGSIYVKDSLTLSQNQRNDSIFKKVHDCFGHHAYEHLQYVLNRIAK